ncbi:YncE family protein [Bacteroidota bacterium]
MRWLYYILFIVTLSAGRSCMNDDSWYEINDLEIKYDTIFQDYIRKQAGVFVVNEGNFMYDNASLSYYMIDSMKVLNEIFFRTNQVPLGDVAQSMTIRDSLGYIVINNSSKIYVFNCYNFEYRGKITGLVSPRSIHFINDSKAYVSDLYARTITIINPLDQGITGHIDISNSSTSYHQHSSEDFVQVADYVFTNSWSFDDKILVIDSQTDRLIDSIQVPNQPNSMVLDSDNYLWVLCDGGFEESPQGQENPALLRIDPMSFQIEENFQLAFNTNPTELNINGTGDTLYFLNGHVYRYVIGEETPPEICIESSYENLNTGGFYGLGIDPYSGDIYVADAIDQLQRGIVYRYRPDGMIVDTFKTGINPGSFCFRPELTTSN